MIHEEATPRSLTDSDVRDILVSTASLTKLAGKYGIDTTAIRAIRTAASPAIAEAVARQELARTTGRASWHSHC